MSIFLGTHPRLGCTSGCTPTPRTKCLQGALSSPAGLGAAWLPFGQDGAPGCVGEAGRLGIGCLERTPTAPVCAPPTHFPRCLLLSTGSWMLLILLSKSSSGKDSPIPLIPLQSCRTWGDSDSAQSRCSACTRAYFSRTGLSQRCLGCMIPA